MLHTTKLCWGVLKGGGWICKDDVCIGKRERERERERERDESDERERERERRKNPIPISH